jgi:hypothetical protein
MSNVFNVATGAIRTSVNTPDFPDPPWLHDPTFDPTIRAVLGVPARFRTFAGGVVRAMTRAESDALVPTDGERDAKITELAAATDERQRLTDAEYATKKTSAETAATVGDLNAIVDITP